MSIKFANKYFLYEFCDYKLQVLISILIDYVWLNTKQIEFPFFLVSSIIAHYANMKIEFTDPLHFLTKNKKYSEIKYFPICPGSCVFMTRVFSVIKKKNQDKILFQLYPCDHL